MAGSEAWHIKNEVGDGPDSRAMHSLPDGGLTPQRALLHETITQAVTERRIDTNPSLSYDKQLRDTIEMLRVSPEYQALEAKGSFTRQDVSALLDKMDLEKLPKVDMAHHTTMMVTGGPATGKTGLLERVREADPERYNDAVKINPDDYKSIFAPPEEFGKAYADIGHREGSMLVESIKGRLGEMMKEGQAPHIVLDVVAPKKHMDLANKSSELVVVTGTVSPEIAVERSFQRGQPRIDADGQQIIGRQTPTFIVLEGSQKVAETTPGVLQHHNVKMGIYDTNVPKGDSPKLVASWNPGAQTLVVKDPDTFIDFVERQNLNLAAKGPDELLDPAHRTPGQIAENLGIYTDKGVRIDLLGADGQVAMSISRAGVDVRAPLDSQRGSGFFDKMAEASKARVSVIHEADKPYANGGKNPGQTHSTQLIDVAAADAARGSGFLADAGRVFAKCAKLLGPLGAVGAGIEVAILGKEAQAAVAGGQISNEALAEYAAGLSAHAAQMTFDPTLVGGEIAVQEWFDDFAQRHELSDELAENLRPSSLLRDIASSPQVTAEQKLFVKIYDSLPEDVTEDMPPELQTMVQLKQQIVAAEHNYENATMKMGTLGQDIMQERLQAEQRLDESQRRFVQQYDEYAQSGALQEHVIAELDMGTPVQPDQAAVPQPDVEPAKSVVSAPRLG